MKQAVLFIGHGTRRQHGVDEFHAFIRAVAAKLDTRLQWAYAFLELQPPTIPDAVEQLRGDGVTQVLCIPLFLFSAGHMKEDIPHELALAKQRCPDVSLRLSEPFGTHPAMQHALFDRLSAVPEFQDRPHQGVLLLGRGNNDKVAQQTFAAVASQIQTRLSHAVIDVAYLDGNGVSLEDTMFSFAERNIRNVVVLPFLWFSGWLTDTLPLRVENCAASAHITAHIAHHIGLYEDVVEAVWRRIEDEIQFVP